MPRPHRIDEAVRSGLTHSAQSVLPPAPERVASTRTNLRLSPRALEAKEWLAAYCGISQKEVLDTVPRYVESIVSPGVWKDVLASSDSSEPPGRTSHAVSRPTLATLNVLAEQYGVSRDHLVDRTLIAVRLLYEHAANKQREKLAALAPRG